MFPLISIIVPIYNSEKYLYRCVDSILEQSFSDFELLLINDGSKDDSGRICDEYFAKDNRVRVFHKENGGASSARNCGLDWAIGKYICFIDADDWIDKDYLKQLMPADGVDMVVCSLKYEGEKIRHLCISDSQRNRKVIEDTLHQMLEHMVICSPCCKMMRRDLIERNNIRFDVKVSAGEDMLFVYDYFSVGLNKIVTISSPLYHYYVIDNESLSHKIVDFKTTEYVLDCIKERIDKLSKIYNWDKNEGYKRLICTQLNNLVAYAKSRSTLLECLKYWKCLLDNHHICILLSDVDYMIKRLGLNRMRSIFFRITIFPVKLYYCFKSPIKRKI